MLKPKHAPPPRSGPPLPLERCLAKTRHLEDGRVVAGRTVEEHCRIVGAVSEALLTGMPDIKRALFPKGAVLAPRTHDVGKVCPTFQEKIYRAAGAGAHSLPELAGVDPELERDWGGHAAVSRAVLEKVQTNRYLPDIVGQHHGWSSPLKPADCGQFGGTAWEERREELISRLTAGDEWPDIADPGQARLVAGLTVVADWIGSGACFDAPEQDWRPLAGEAVEAAGFQPLRLRRGLDFNAIFPFSPNPVQDAFLSSVTGPGVYILEAPMGLGKTEAALYAAYCLLEREQACGLYFALPTQLTSNRIHDRVNAFLERILEPDAGQRFAVLTHGQAWLKRFLDLQEMGEEAAPGGSWFESGKRGILAPVAVGTVDQALMAVMHVRHAAVRAFGLAGKVVVLDEVHSYDAYTGTLLEELVQTLRAFNCTVIILSATLTRERRAALAGEALSRDEYPLITARPDSAAAALESPCPRGDAHSVRIALIRDQEEAFEEALLRAEQGEQVLWIENTVAEAQSRYRLCAARASAMGVETGLVHSRFTPADRERNETRWTGLYGADSDLRPQCGRVLIGTQVLEQSLDIDADFLVTRLCPTDMLLQRLGRLWRHTRSNRAPSAGREARVLAADLDAALQSPCTAFAASGFVYSPYVLSRSLEVWEGRASVSLPDDIRGLLQATYSARPVEPSPGMQAALRELEQDRNRLKGQAWRGLSATGPVLPEEKASTRLLDRPQAEVLLLRELDRAAGRCRLADGTEIRLEAFSHRSQRRNVAARIALNTVRVPANAAPEQELLRAEKRFRPYVYAGSGLRGALLQPDGACADLRGMPLEGRMYSSEIGYVAERRENGGPF